MISYEEYHPYGSTAFHLSSASSQVSAKRYRYTGKEKDEEMGLYYHGARYYAAWLGRRTAAEPAGLVDGLNLYRYSRDNPIRFSDPSGTMSHGFSSLPGSQLLGLDAIEASFAELDALEEELGPSPEDVAAAKAKASRPKRKTRKPGVLTELLRLGMGSAIPPPDADEGLPPGLQAMQVGANR